MRRSRSRFALASELATVVLMRPFIDASASMKKFTVDPVPTPMVASSSTYFSAASAAAFFCAFASMRGSITGYAFDPDEERRVPRPHTRREGVRRGDREPARRAAFDLASHRQQRPAQARG